MRSIKWKLVLLYLVIIFVVMLLSGIYIIVQTQNNEMKKAKNELEQYATRIQEQVLESYDGEENFQQAFRKTLLTSASLQGNILNEKGETIATTVSSVKPYPNYKYSVIISAMTGAPAFSTGKIGVDNQGFLREWLSYATPVSVDGKIKYIIFVRMDTKNIKDGIQQTKITIFTALIFTLVAASVLSYIFARTLTEPIIILTRRARDLARGHLNQVIPVKSDDEVGQLTGNFNYMAKELNRTIESMTREKSKLEAVLHNMADGVLAFDYNRNLIHANQMSKEFLEFSDMNLSFQELAEKTGVNEEEVYMLLPEETKETTFAIEDRYINASFAPYTNNENIIDGIVVVLQDITKHKILEEMRKEFVANVSHELRTPLATIKSYSETLMNGAIDEREIAADFLKIINSEVDRMTFIVKDLLQLSRLDSRQTSFDKKEVVLNDLLEENTNKNRILAANKNQLLIYIAPKATMTVEVDAQRINQVLNNIITNAYKYSPEGTLVKVSTEETDKYYKVHIKDNGIGIPKEHQKRIFERFYRVDKARSREMGGTGLGLSIAKEIMTEHGGNITVESEQDKGTIMTLHFPKYVK